MKRITVLISLIFCFIYCRAQQARVEKAHAFYTVSFAGMAMKDEHGNIIPPPQIIERFIYLECRFSGKPKIDSVFYNGIFFIPALDTAAVRTVQAGIETASGKPVNLNAKKGNYFWRINLQQAFGKELSPELVKKITIKGKMNKTKFTCNLTTQTELASPERN